MKHRGDLLLFLAAFIGGSGFISSKYLLDWGYTPYQVIFGRFLVAALCLGIFYWKAWKNITKSEWKVGSILGLLLAATFLLLTLGLQYTTPAGLRRGTVLWGIHCFFLANGAYGADDCRL